MRSIDYHLPSFRPDGWTEYMDAIFEYLHENKITQKDFFDCLREIPLVNGNAAS